MDTLELYQEMDNGALEINNAFTTDMHPYLDDSMVADAVHESSEFFHIDDPISIREAGTTGVYTGMSFTEKDDVLVFSRDQLDNMGITDKEGLDLVMTHEAAHRVLQGSGIYFTSHQEELCCDYMAGVRAGLNNLDATKMENSLADTHESISHPDGQDRVAAIERGQQFARDYYAQHGVSPSLQECLAHFGQDLPHIQHEQITLRDDYRLSAFREEQDSCFALHSEQDDPFHGYKNDGETTGAVGKVDDSTFKGMFVNDKSWNEDQAKWYSQIEKRECHEAELAEQRGDFVAMKKHIESAKSNEKLANEYYNAAKKSTKD